MPLITNGESGLNVRTSLNRLVDRMIDIRDYSPDLTGATSSRTALNSAIADAITNQIPLFLCNGHYKVNGSTWDATTNSLLTGTVATGVTAGQVQIAIIGQSLGRINYTDNSYVGGVVINASGATGASGTMPSVLSFAPFIEPNHDTYDPDEFVDANPILRNITFLVPNNSTFGAVNLHNCLSCDVAQILCYGVSDGSGNPPVCTHAAAVGFIPPGPFNRKLLALRDSRFQGFYDGLWSGEHLVISGVDSSLNKNGLRLRYGGHPVVGDICIEACECMVRVDADADRCPFVLNVHGEIGLVSTPYTALGSGAGLYDVGNTASGILQYWLITPGVFGAEMQAVGGASVRLDNMAAPGQFSASGLTTPIAKYNLASLADSAGSFTLTDHGTITFAAGKVGNCAVFNGSTQYATSSINLQSSDFTIAFWLNVTTAADAYVVAQWGSVGLNNRFQCYVASDGTVNFQVAAIGGSSPIATSAALTPGTWYFIVLQWSETTHISRMKVNNGSWITPSAAAAGMAVSGTAEIFSLAGNAVGTLPADIKLDAMRVLDSEISDAEITTLYNGGAGTEA